MILKKDIVKNDLEKIYIHQFTLILKSPDYHSITNCTSANDFVYNKEKTKLHLWISWTREFKKSWVNFFH